MRNAIESFARSSRRALLGALTVLAAASAALPAGADPTLGYSTYLGGSLGEGGFAVAVREGSTFVAGITNSPDYPVVAVSSGKWGDEQVRQVFVTALGPSGTPFYSTYVPITDDNGPRRMHPLGIGVGPDGSAYVVAVTFEFGSDPFSLNVAKLEPGGALAWSFGGYSYGQAFPRGMTLDSQGNVYITGQGKSQDPYSGEVRNTAFVEKIRGADGWMSYWADVGGNGSETTGRSIAVDAAGNAYVLGTTDSTNLPKAIQAAPAGGSNAFVTKLDPAGSILWSTYLGPGEGREIRVAADGSLVVVGTTGSTQFPTLNAIQTELRGPRDLFLARLKPWGSRISSTYLGGSGTEEVEDLALEASSILLAVSSPEADSPLRAALDPSCGNVYFVAKLDATASRVLDGACLGGSYISGVAADSSGVSLTGGAAADLPLVDAWQPAPAGGVSEAFAAKLVLNDPPDCSAATASPNTLWPADGRFVSVFLRGITDLEGGRVTIALTSIFQDEGLTQPGTPDATGLGTSTARLRATRLNGGDGRVYHVSFTATDPQGGACTGTVKVCVPVAQGGTCGDGGARVDSTRAN